MAAVIPATFPNSSLAQIYMNVPDKIYVKANSSLVLSKNVNPIKWKIEIIKYGKKYINSKYVSPYPRFNSAAQRGKVCSLNNTL